MNADRWRLEHSRCRRLTLSGRRVVLERSDWCSGWGGRRDRRVLFVGHRSRFHDTGCLVFLVYSLKNRTGGFFFVPRKGIYRQCSPLNGVRDDRDQLVDDVLEKDLDDQRCTNVKFRLASSMPCLSWWPPPLTSAPASAGQASPVRCWWWSWSAFSSRTSSMSYSAPRAVGTCRNCEFWRFTAIQAGKRAVSTYEPRGEPRKAQIVAPQIFDTRWWSRRRVPGGKHDRGPRRGRRRAAPADQQRSARSVLGTPPAGGLVCGRCGVTGARAADPGTVEARQPAQRSEQAARNADRSGSSRGGIQRAYRSTGGIVP